MSLTTKNCAPIFICMHKKEQGKSCAQNKAEAIFEYFKEQLNLKYPELDPHIKFKIVKTSCLGQCAIGPNLLISPDNIWYNYNSFEDIDEIIDVHLIQRKIVGRLINKAIHSNHENIQLKI